MSNLFMPKDQKELSDLITEKVPVLKNGSDEVLVYTDYYDTFVLDGFDSVPVKVQGMHHIRDLCSHGDMIVAADSKGVVFDMVDGRTIEDYDNNGLYALCSHEGTLYAGVSYSGIFVVGNHKKIRIAEKHGNINSLCSHRAILYDGTESRVYKSLTDVLICDLPDFITGMCSFNDVLYNATQRGLFIGEASLKGYAEAFSDVFEFDGKIYASTKAGYVYDVEERDIVKFLENANSIISVPRKSAEALM